LDALLSSDVRFLVEIGGSHASPRWMGVVIVVAFAMVVWDRIAICRMHIRRDKPRRFRPALREPDFRGCGNFWLGAIALQGIDE
jgi:hypothetical protein